MAVAAIYQPVAAGNVYVACQQTGVTTTAGLSTDCKPIALFNPSNSSKNLIIRWAAWNITVAAATAGEVWLASNTLGATGTAAVVTNALVGSANNSTATPLITATLGATPVARVPLGTMLTGAITTSIANGWQLFRFDGDLIVAPGGCISFQTGVASGASGFFSAISWEERPVAADAGLSI